MDDELDASQYFRQSTSDQAILQVRDMDDVLRIFGYSKDDRIDRRDLCLMYNAVSKNMEDEVHRLAHTAKYDDAKDMRARLGSLRKAFDGQQTNGVSVSQQDQLKNFEKASAVMRRSVREKLGEQQREVHEYIHQLKGDQAKFHKIQWENLELKISRIVRPRMKYSKRTQELFVAENELIRLSQYDDARKVNNMLAKIVPKETAEYYAKFEASIEDMRKELRKTQEEDSLRLGEKLKSIAWKDIRSQRAQRTLCDQRIKNHDKDMRHAHLADSLLRPEMSIKPSALWQKRENYNHTAAALRGSQLLDYSMGAKKSAKGTITAPSLVERHDFANSLQDTITLNL